MKKTVFFLSIIALFSSCSPQYRLNSLLHRHPELKTTTIAHEIKDTIQLPHVRIEHSVALSDLQYIALSAPLPLTEENSCDKREQRSSLQLPSEARILSKAKKAIHNPSIPIEAGCAALSITPHPTSRDSLLFTLQQLPEVIVLCDTVEVPNIIATEVPAQPTTWQQFCHWSGIITWLIILFIIVNKAAQAYCKRR